MDAVIVLYYKKNVLNSTGLAHGEKTMVISYHCWKNGEMIDNTPEGLKGLPPMSEPFLEAIKEDKILRCFPPMV